MHRPRPSLAACMLLDVATAGRSENWPAWRGPRLDGTSLGRPAPLHWSATNNVVWKTPLPGYGHASLVSSAGNAHFPKDEGVTNVGHPGLGGAGGPGR